MDISDLLSHPVAHHAFHYTLVGKALVRFGGEVAMVNRSLCNMLGYTEQELLRMRILDIIYTEDVPLYNGFMNDLLGGNSDYVEMENRYICLDGRHKWGMTTLSVIDVEGHPERVFLIQVQEITYRKRLVELNEAYADKFRILADHHSDLVYDVMLDGSFSYVNRACTKLWGDDLYELERALGDTIRKSLEHVMESFTNSPFEMETSFEAKDGKMLKYSVLNIPNFIQNELVGLHCIARDITLQSNMERDLKHSEKKYRLLADHTGEMIATLNINGIIYYISPACKPLLGYDATELIGRPVWELFYPPDIEKLGSQEWMNEDGYSNILRLRRRDGSSVWVEVVSNTLRYDSGNVREIVFRDITSRKTLEDVLATQERVMSDIVETMDVGVVICDENGILTSMNRAARQLHDFVKIPLSPEHWSSVYGLYQTDGKTLLSKERAPLYRAYRGESFRDLEMVVKKSNGEHRLILCHGKPIIVHNKIVGGICVMHDITEFDAAKQSAHQADKLSIAGQMAAGIAHEIRNPLTALKGFLQLLSAGKEKGSKYYDIMKEELTRIELILNELLALAKPQEMNMTQHDLSKLIQDIVVLLQTQATLHNVEIHSHPTKEPVQIRCDGNKIKQLFINLIEHFAEI
ncbi:MULTISPECIES: PAS domain S-box protein [Brevibacillus]